MGEIGEIVVPSELERSHGSLRADQSADASALSLLADLSRYLGGDDLGGMCCLDVGCGVKFTRAIINHGLPIGRYVGIDVAEPVITWLRSEVADVRFSFAHFDVHNERYNPGAERLHAGTALPVDDERFDVALGYSLFTHLDPSDFAAMLTLIRRVVRPGGHIVFTAFLDQHSASGLGMIDRYSQKLGGSIAGVSRQRGDGYVDLFPDDPLRVTLYDLPRVQGLLTDTGWELVAVHDPTEFAQHTVVATPASSASP